MNDLRSYREMPALLARRHAAPVSSIVLPTHRMCFPWLQDRMFDDQHDDNEGE